MGIIQVRQSEMCVHHLKYDTCSPCCWTKLWKTAVPLNWSWHARGADVRGSWWRRLSYRSDHLTHNCTTSLLRFLNTHTSSNMPVRVASTDHSSQMIAQTVQRERVHSRSQKKDKRGVLKSGLACKSVFFNNNKKKLVARWEPCSWVQSCFCKTDLSYDGYKTVGGNDRLLK